MGSNSGQPVTAYVALGSNLGDREQYIRDALEMLDAQGDVKVVRCSKLMESDAVGGPAGQGPFLNAVAKVRTELSPHELLRLCHEIEDALGRRRDAHWGPRTIDLDILLYGDQVIETDDLRIPHPRLHERSFVLRPLLEIAPDATHPVMRKTIRQLAQALDAGSEGTA